MGVVAIQCKTPNGLDLQLRGSSEVVNVKGYLNSEIVENGAGITFDIDKLFWEKWYSENKDSSACKEGVISALNESE